MFKSLEFISQDLIEIPDPLTNNYLKGLFVCSVNKNVPLSDPICDIIIKIYKPFYTYIEDQLPNEYNLEFINSNFAKIFEKEYYDCAIININRTDKLFGNSKLSDYDKNLQLLNAGLIAIISKMLDRISYIYGSIEVTDKTFQKYVLDKFARI